MSDIQRELKRILQRDDRYNRQAGLWSLQGVLLTRGTWFPGRANSSDYKLCKLWKWRRRPKAKHCFYNAQWFCIYHDDARFRYFEGYFLCPPHNIIVNHGWVVMPDGKVVDFTLEAADRELKKERGIEKDSSQAVYCGLEIPTQFVAQMSCKKRAYEPVAAEFIKSQGS